MIDFTCSYCNKNYYNHFNLKRHQQSCRLKYKHEKDILEKKYNETIKEKDLIIEVLKTENKEIKEQNELDIKVLKEYIERLKNENKEIKEQNELDIKVLKDIERLKNENKEMKEHELDIKFLKEEIEKLKTENTILKKTSEERKINYDMLLHKFDRPNSVTINKTTVKQIVSKLEPICFNKIKESMSLFTKEYIDEGIKGFAQFLCDHSLNNKFITTDHSRNIIAYRTDFYDFIRDPECLKLINKTLLENHEEIIRKSIDRMEHYRQLMDSDDEEYAYCSETAMRVYELKKFAEASVNQKPDENIKAIANIFCKHGLNTYQNSIDKKE